jgi:hypothetical protein
LQSAFGDQGSRRDQRLPKWGARDVVMKPTFAKANSIDRLEPFAMPRLEE